LILLGITAVVPPNLQISAVIAAQLRKACISQVITNRVERGELTKAYVAAEALVKSHPESGQAHFTLAYVLRYAGMQEESVRECDIALEIFPGNYQWRSCAWGFMELGQTQQCDGFCQSRCRLGMNLPSTFGFCNLLILQSEESAKTPTEACPSYNYRTILLVEKPATGH
jgi:hypothetical protein